jgi:hypothetical protein
MLYASMYWEQDRASWLRWMWWYNPAPPTGEPYVPPAGAAVTGAVVEGKGVVGERLPFSVIDGQGLYAPVIVVDYNVRGDTQVTPGERAEFAARDAVQGMTGGCIMGPLNPCLELWDRVRIVDPRATVSPMDRRVAGIESYYDRRGKRFVFDQVVYLWGMEPW